MCNQIHLQNKAIIILIKMIILFEHRQSVVLPIVTELSFLQITYNRHPIPRP